MRKITTVLFCFFVSIGMGSSFCLNQFETIRLNWKTFNGPNYTIQFPSDWELNQSKQMGTEFFLFSPLESSQDKFRENVNLLIQDLAGYNIDLKKYAQMSEAQVKTMITNSNLLLSQEVKSPKGNYYHMAYTGDQGEFKLHFDQYYWVKNEKAYVLTFSAEKDKYASYSEVGSGILNSYEFTK